MLTIISLVFLLAMGIMMMVWAAEVLIDQVQYLSRKYRLSPLLMGAVLLGFSTSLPEIVVAVAANLNNTPLVAYGNAVGSNLANIALIFGLGLCIAAPTAIKLTRWDAYQLFAVLLTAVLFLGFAWDQLLTPAEAYIFLALFGAFIIMILAIGDKTAQPVTAAVVPRNGLKVLFLISLGIAGIGLGGELTVSNAAGLAVALGVPQQLISLTLVALGTSIPELVVTIKLATRKQLGLVVGNILGSNIFNIFLVLPLVHLTRPLQLSAPNEVYRDGSFMLLLTVAFIFIVLRLRVQRHWQQPLFGSILLLSYAAYLGILAWSLLAL